MDRPRVAKLVNVNRGAGCRMYRKRPPYHISTSAAARLLQHTAMGAAMGLALGLLVMILDPPIAALVENQGNSTVWVLAGTLIAVFAVGSTLTGALFISLEE